MRNIIIAGFAGLTLASALAVSVGDRYDQVIKELGKPIGVMGGGNRQVLSYPDGIIAIQDGRVENIDPAFTDRARKRKMQAADDARNRAKGLVPFDGRWVTPVERDALEQAQRTAQTKANNQQIDMASSRQAEKANGRQAISLQPEGIGRYMSNYVINAKLFDNPALYFASELLLRARDVESKIAQNKMTPEQCVSYAAGEMTAFLFIPALYDGKTPYGLYVDIRPGNTSVIPEDYIQVMNARRMLFVSPYNAGNEVDTFRRLALALDSMASVKKEFNIDSNRVVIGGLSGGGAAACEALMLYPDYFKGVVSHARHAALFSLPAPNKGSYLPTFLFCRNDDYRRVAGRGKRWVFISGSNDFNYVYIQKCMPQWKQVGFDARFIDVPGMGHSDAPSEYFDQALMWICR